MKAIQRYSIETPPYAKGRIEPDERGDLCKFADVDDLLEEAAYWIRLMNNHTDVDDEGAVTEFIEKLGYER